MFSASTIISSAVVDKNKNYTYIYQPIKFVRLNQPINAISLSQPMKSVRSPYIWYKPVQQN